MKPLSAKQMQQLDKWAINDLGIPQIALMENAGRAVADQVAAVTKPGKVCVVAYKGNNGGDGFVAARHLSNLGYDIAVLLLCDPNEITGSAKINFDILKKINILIKSLEPRRSVSGSNMVKGLLKSSHIIIDAIFGLGLKGEISGICAQAIDLINQHRQKSKCLVVSVDVPSGVNATTGKVAKHSIRADYTVTFAAPKTGFLKFPAIKQIGRLTVADIGIPNFVAAKLASLSSLKSGRASSATTINLEYFLPKRLTWTHKGSYGKVLIVAGSKTMSGAAYLTALSALRAGAGLVYLAVPKSIQKFVATKVREIITIPLPETNEGTISQEALAEILRIKADVLALGPGLTTNQSTQKLVKKLVTTYKAQYLVIDADALNCLGGDVALLKKAKSKIVITPHPGEMGRLTGKSVAQIQKNRPKIARDFAQKYAVEVVLKGAYTVFADRKKVFLNSSGNPGLAKAGTGDVLCGLIASFLGQGLKVNEAVYVHGLAADLAVKEKGEYSLIAGDVVEKIPSAISRIS